MKTEVYVMSTSSRVDPRIFPALTPPCFFFFRCLGTEEHGHLGCRVLERVEKEGAWVPDSLLGGGANEDHPFGVGQRNNKPPSCVGHSPRPRLFGQVADVPLIR